MSRKTTGIISFVLNLLTFLFTDWAVAQFFVATGSGNMATAGTDCFRYFTIDSNILAAVASLFLLPFEIKAFSGKTVEVPRWLLLLKFAGTASVAVTLIVVLVFLGPTIGYGKMFEGGNIYLHGICPILALVSFLFFDSETPIEKEASWPALLPVFIYGLLYLFMVIVVTEAGGGWEDFYGFNRNGLWPVSLAIMFTFNLILVFALRKLRNKFINSKTRSA